MKSRYGLLSALSAVILFLLLETLSVVLVVRGSVVQRYKVLGTVRSIESWFWERTSHIGQFFSLRTENERLAAENLQLRQQAAWYAALQKELEVTDILVEPEFTYYSATVIRNSVNRQHNFLILDKGSKDGIEDGMGVITSRGIIGIVSGVSRHYCYVVSLLNTEQSASVKLSGSGAFGPMTWPGRAPDIAILREIPIHIQAAPGDTVLTSGFSTLYPPDIPVGTVVSAAVSNGSSQDLTIRLLEDFRSLHHVYIVKNNRRQELEELYEKLP